MGTILRGTVARARWAGPGPAPIPLDGAEREEAAAVANAQGLDVSSYQGTYDWQAEKGKISFAFVKATEGNTVTDPQFARNWQQAKALGIVRGAYCLGHPSDGGASNAAHFLSVVRAQGLQAGDLLVLDLEVGDGRGPAQVAAYARAWCADVKAATGHTPIVYTFVDFAREGYCAGLGRYPLWIADPNHPAGHPTVPAPWTKWYFQQYATNVVDRDVFNGDTAALREFANPKQPAQQEDEVQSGSLMNGANVVTAISIPQGSAKTIGFACDNGLQQLPPAQLRVAVWDGGWEVHNPVVVDSSKGQTVVTFSKPKSTSAISVQRLDAGNVNVGYQVS
jgi:GH25 family lysozyme M1 (1,4-beta-N-acetylmuramidase)